MEDNSLKTFSTLFYIFKFFVLDLICGLFFFYFDFKYSLSINFNNFKNKYLNNIYSNNNRLDDFIKQ